jgi:hypothetical protein
VPEFLHQPIYDDKHRTNLIRFGDDRPHILQKGIRERLLCDECERRFQEFEDYFARYWYQRRPFPDPPLPQEVLLSDLDYGRVKLFLLSIIWHASVAKSPTFKSADLGPHEDRIRQLLFSGDPGPADHYQIYAGLIVDPDSRELWDCVILAPLRIRVRGLWAYRLVFGGASWTILISRHQALPIAGHFLTEFGCLRLPSLGWPDFARESGLVEAARPVAPMGTAQQRDEADRS